MKAERGQVLEALYAAPDGLDGFVSCSGVGPTSLRMSSSALTILLPEK